MIDDAPIIYPTPDPEETSWPAVFLTFIIIFVIAIAIVS